MINRLRVEGGCSFFFFKQKTAYEIDMCLEFRRVLFRSVRRGDKWVLRGISWQLRCGQRWALIGENGAGKTQLLKLLCGDVWPTPRSATRRAATRRAATSRDHTLLAAGARPQGRIYEAEGREIDLMDAKRRIAYVGAEQQDKYARYGWNLRVRDLIATGLHRTDLLLMPVTAAQARRVAATLRAYGLQRHAERRFLSLSYGQQRLALLARAMIQDPDWLLLDEFYNGLDAGFRRRMDMALDAAARSGRSWVATAHRAVDVPRGTAHVLELKAGQVRALKEMGARDLARLTARARESPRTRARPRKVAPARAPLLMRLSK